ncbi:fungal-specific transcription factor domain-containing protein [Xylariaceae sp. FL0016]|nr:fungal-specific transcription factor domain-containing protein [Xylariaceae sp. FL0016]
MTSVLAVTPSNFQPSLPMSRPRPAMTQLQEPTPPQHVKHEDDVCSGRRGSGSGDRDIDMEINDSDHAGDGEKNDNSSNSDGPVKKRRRSRKGLDKKFECPTEGCGKSYSRAEHLYRHQLNHSPKQIYRCDFQDCNRQFVRLDLCNRHKDRHTAKGSALSRKDSLISQSSPTDNVRSPYPTPGSTSASPRYSRPGNPFPEYGAHLQYQSPKDAVGTPYTPITNTPPAGFPPTGPSNAIDGYIHRGQGYGGAQHAHQSPGGPPRPHVQTNVGSYGVMSPLSAQHGSYQSQRSHTPQSVASVPYATPNNFPPFALPPSDFSSAPVDGVAHNPSQHYAATTTASEYPDQSQPQANNDMVILDHMASPATFPVFGPGGLNKSPYISIPEDFITYLFNTTSADSSPSMTQVLQRNPQSKYAPSNTHGPLALFGLTSCSYGEYQNQYTIPYFTSEGVPVGDFPNQPQQVMAVTNLLDANVPENVLSEEKSQEIFDFIKERFHENDHTPVERQKDNILEGDRSDENHMLSREMMQQYIGTYWLQFSDQLPILHKPTFSPDKTPNLLLLAVMTIGAACLDKSHGPEVTKAGAQLSNFLAWHLRWEIFMDSNCRPPAKLWTFQALLLLELYEKMYSTRELHERAHIHHATTITLMRRGRSLLGKTSLDSPPSVRDEKPGSNGSRHSSTSAFVHTPDGRWNEWITTESTKRAAFAAFLIDSIHAMMFGHSTVMVAHEMRLPLPCDDDLWKAPSGGDVGRIEANLMSKGIKPISFLEGLKRTLSGNEVQTNPFGRQILMAGLLSVCWHMNQRDLQVSSLGGNMSTALGGRDKWRATLTRAFDSWRQDFDKSLQRFESPVDPYRYEQQNDPNIVFESRTVLHHLAHMAMHVDIVDCQIFARARRLLGRSIGTQDLNSAQRRMRDNWAPSAKARDATFYAAKFLHAVLFDMANTCPSGGVMYVARDDVLLNRPWVLYYAALVVWCYGFALEGPCPGVTVPDTPREKHVQMRAYLQKLGSVETPEDLKSMKGVNQNSALLSVLKDSFASTRWDLLHEGANLLGNCIQLNSGGTV